MAEKSVVRPASHEAAGIIAPAAAPGQAVEMVDTDASRVRFLYPFTYDGATIDARAEAVERLTWTGPHKQLTVWRTHAVSLEDLLPPVADFIKPRSGEPRSAEYWRMDDEALRSSGGLGGGATHSYADWQLAAPHVNIPFAWRAVELALFRHGVGFLIVDANPVDRDVAAWFDFIHHFRFQRGQRAGELSATRTVSVDAQDDHPVRVPFFATPGREAPTSGGVHAQTLGGIIDALLDGASGDGTHSRWWEDIFVSSLLIPYATLFIDRCPPEHIELHLYRLRNFFSMHQEVHPAIVGAATSDGALLPYAADQWFFFSLNGGGFLACDAPQTPFWRANLPEHVNAEYFVVFLLALLQRFVLMKLSTQVSREWVAGDSHHPNGGDESPRATAFSRIRDALLAFTAQGYFAQTTQQEHHHRCYERWQQTFNLARLYDDVSAEVREMYTYLDLRQRARAEAIARQQEERTRNVERRLNLLGWVLGVPVWLFLAINSSANVAVIRHFIFGPAGLQGYDPLLALGLVGIGLIVALTAYRFVSRQVGVAGRNDRGKRTDRG